MLVALDWLVWEGGLRRQHVSSVWDDEKELVMR